MNDKILRLQGKMLVKEKAKTKAKNINGIAKRVSNFFTKWFFFNGSLLSVDHAIDFEIRGKQPRAIVETNLFRLFWAIIIACTNRPLH